MCADAASFANIVSLPSLRFAFHVVATIRIHAIASTTRLRHRLDVFYAVGTTRLMLSMYRRHTSAPSRRRVTPLARHRRGHDPLRPLPVERRSVAGQCLGRLGIVAAAESVGCRFDEGLSDSERRSVAAQFLGRLGGQSGLLAAAESAGCRFDEGLSNSERLKEAAQFLGRRGIVAAAESVRIYTRSS